MANANLALEIKTPDLEFGSINNLDLSNFAQNFVLSILLLFLLILLMILFILTNTKSLIKSFTSVIFVSVAAIWRKP